MGTVRSSWSFELGGALKGPVWKAQAAATDVDRSADIEGIGGERDPNSYHRDVS